MAGSTAAPRIPLPEGWPRWVRSAVGVLLQEFSVRSTSEFEAPATAHRS